MIPSEIITGDLPTPIKYYAPEIRDAYKKVENIAANQLLKELPEDMQEAYEDILIEDDSIEWKYVKAADKLSAYIKVYRRTKIPAIQILLRQKIQLRKSL